MKLNSVNVGSQQQLGHLTTGIFKQPALEAVPLSDLGLHEDAICDTKYHGGLDQALYLYGQLDYDYWLQEHQLDLEPGTFGENLTIDELSSLTVYIGDQFQIGEVLLEATAPRIPCNTLGMRMKNPKFPIAFRHSGRSGFYCRVLSTGDLESGMSVEKFANQADSRVSIKELFELNYNPRPSLTEIDRVLSTPVAIRERERLMQLRQKLYG